MPSPTRRRCRLSFEPLEPREVPATVTSLLDDGSPGTLRSAIAATAAGGVIDFAHGLTGTITLNGSELRIDKNLTLRGPSAATVSISGNNLSRIFAIDNGTPGADIDVAILSLTLVGGNTSEDGGAISNRERLKLATCTLVGNTALSSGGAVANYGALALVSCAVTANMAASETTGGGGIYNLGSQLTLTACTVSNNFASGGYGGGVLNGTTTAATLLNCTFKGNTSVRGGGAVYHVDGPLTVANSDFYSNTATANYGGAIYNLNGTMRVTGGSLSGNATTSSYGGGSYGGGIYNNAGGRATLSGCVLSGNSAFSGGAIANTGTLDMDRCYVEGNSAAYEGGGINHKIGTLTLTRCWLSGNSATRGGAIFGSDVLTLTGCTLSGNSAGESGGGILGGGTLTNCTLSGNSAGESGGGISTGGATLTNCTLSDNAAASGGGIRVEGNHGTFTLNNTIVANSAGGDLLITLIGSATATGSHNLIEDGSGGLADTIPGDPLLGPLADNGGPTRTHALLAGSPAIDAGGNAAAAGLRTDQRGFTPRAAGGTVDIGAVEAGAVLPPLPPLAVGGPADGTARLFDPSGGQYGTTPVATLTPFGTIPTNVRTATGDVNADGTPDTVLVTGPGTPIRVAVVCGADNNTLLVSPFDPFGGDFPGGGFVAAADLDADGRAEFVVTPDQGGGPRVTVFALNADGTLATRANFLGIDDPAFRGGARPALGDVDGDGTPDLIVAAGFGGGPRVAVYDGATVLGTPTRLIGDFFAFPGADANTLRNGAFVAAGDVDGDGFADLAFGGGPGGAPRVFILSGALVSTGSVAGAQAAPVANFFVAGNATDRGGVRVAAKNGDGDAKADVVVGSGEGSPARVRVYLGASFTTAAEPATFQDLTPFDGAALAGGVFIG